MNGWIGAHFYHTAAISWYVYIWHDKFPCAYVLAVMCIRNARCLPLPCIAEQGHSDNIRTVSEILFRFSAAQCGTLEEVHYKRVGASVFYFSRDSTIPFRMAPILPLLICSAITCVWALALSLAIEPYILYQLWHPTHAHHTHTHTHNSPHSNGAYNKYISVELDNALAPDESAI